jgi:hypothetical protein
MNQDVKKIGFFEQTIRLFNEQGRELHLLRCGRNVGLYLFVEGRGSVKGATITPEGGAPVIRRFDGRAACEQAVSSLNGQDDLKRNENLVILARRQTAAWERDYRMGSRNMPVAEVDFVNCIVALDYILMDPTNMEFARVFRVMTWAQAHQAS